MGTEALEKEIRKVKDLVSAIFTRMCTDSNGVDIPNIESIDPLTAGSVEAGKKSVSFQNTGGTEILIKGIAIPSGDIIEFTASPGNVLDEISYNSQLSTILIITLE